MSKYEQLIEFIINEQDDKARELFHQIVVEKSREIYESIIDEEDLEEIGGDQVEDMMDEVTADETGMAEAEDEEIDVDMSADDDLEVDGMDADMDADMDDELEVDTDMEMGDEDEDVSSMDLADAKEEIDAIFDRLMTQLGGSESDEEMDMMPADDEEESAEDSEEDMFEADDDEKEEDEEDDDDDEEDLQESRKDAKKEDMLKAKDKEAKGKRKMTEAEWLREYVDQIGDVYSQEPAQEEGHEVGKGKKVKVDKSSTAVGPGVDMGGKVVKTKGEEQNPDDKQTPEPNNEYTKGRGNLPHAGKFQNVPGAKTKPSNSGKPEYSKAHGAEGQTTSGKVPVTSKSPIAKA
jgi:hypothetical protein